VLSRAVSRQLHDNDVDEDNIVDPYDVVDKSADKADSEAVERPVDCEVDERADVIYLVATKGGNVESRSVDADADGSNDCFAATSKPPPTHR